MIYISVQPSELFFLWQLDIQLQNFNEIGILNENIHVIIGYKVCIAETFIFYDLERKNLATFFYYKDERQDPKYVSSIRPHLLKKHIRSNPLLKKSVIFYHDSDIIFREKINEDLFVNDKVIYLSNARSYLSSEYLLSFGRDFFEEMCKIVDISPSLVEISSISSGGAQYVLKDVDFNIFDSVEKDSELIYSYLTKFNESNTNKKVQAWCADMWAILWNLWKNNKTTKIHQELNFCWPKDLKSKWNITKIFHNAGVFFEDRDKYFCKLMYKNTSPFGIDFSYIDQRYCSSIFTQKINSVSNVDAKKHLIDLTIFIHVSSEHNFANKKLLTYLRYLAKYLFVEIIVLETTDVPLMISKDVGIYCKFLRRPNAEIGNIIKKYVKKPFFLYVDYSIFLPIENILNSYRCINKDINCFVQPYSRLSDVNEKNYILFTQTLDSKYLSISPIRRISGFSECYLISLRNYVKSGGENLIWEYYFQDGFNLERESRMRSLSFKLIRINLPAYRISSVYFLDKKRQSFQISEKLYLKRVNNLFKKELLKELKFLEYSFRKKRTLNKIQKDLESIIIKTTSLYEFGCLGDNLNCQNSNYKNNKINSVIWEYFISKIKSHDFNQQPFMVFKGNNVELTNSFSLGKFKELCIEFINSDLDILYGGSTNSFTEIKKISENFFWIDKCYSLNLIFLSKDICDKLLNLNPVTNFSLNIILNEVTQFKAVVFPFIAIHKKIDKFNIENPHFVYDDELSESFMEASTIITQTFSKGD